MTPQERELITALFDRLAALENAPRDADAERVIAEGLARAPHAIYPLVQSVLVQDEALKVANARIEELEAALAEPDAGKPQGGFLDTMRDSLLGRREAPHASVPSVHPGGSPGGSPWASAPGYRGEAPAGQPGGSPWASSQGYRADSQGYRAEAPPPSAGMAPAPSGYGGSFLGTAAASAAGMIGGGLLLNGIRSMLGGHQRGAFAGTFDQLGAGRGQAAPGGGQGSNDLARQAGLDDIGRSPAAGSGTAEPGRAASAFGSSDEDRDHHEGDDHDTGDDDNDDADDGDDSDSDDSDDSSGEPS